MDRKVSLCKCGHPMSHHFSYGCMDCDCKEVEPDAHKASDGAVT